MKNYYYIKKLRKPTVDGIIHEKSQVFATFEEMYNECPVTKKVFDDKYPCEVMQGISAEEHMHELLTLLNSQCVSVTNFIGDNFSLCSVIVYEDDSFTTHDAELAAKIFEEVEMIVFYCEILRHRII